MYLFIYLPTDLFINLFVHLLINIYTHLIKLITLFIYSYNLLFLSHSQFGLTRALLISPWVHHCMYQCHSLGNTITQREL